jgi:hypothetical protein
VSLDIEAILGEATPQERTVPLLLRGDLRARWDQLEHELDAAPAEAISLGDIAPAKRVAQQMEDLREQIKAAEVPFRLRALPPREWAKFLDAKPERKEQTDDEWADIWHAYICQMVAVCCVEPVMSAEQVDRLVPVLSNQQWTDLSNAAWRLNSEREAVPFSVAASALTQIDGGKLKQPGPLGFPSPDSSAGSRSKPRRTSTTRKAASPKR